MSLRWHGDFDGTSVEGLDKWRLMARLVVVTLILWVSIPVKRVGKLFFFLLNLYKEYRKYYLCMYTFVCNVNYSGQEKGSPQTWTFVHDVFEMIWANVIEFQLFWFSVIQITPFDVMDPFFDSAKNQHSGVKKLHLAPLSIGSIFRISNWQNHKLAWVVNKLFMHVNCSQFLCSNTCQITSKMSYSGCRPDFSDWITLLKHA